MDRKDGSFYLLREAFNSFRRKNYEEACPLLEQLNSPEPVHPYPCFLYAAALLYTGKLGRAEHFLSVLEKRWPDYLPGVELRTFLQMKSASSGEQGLEIFMSALKKFPRDRNLLLGAAVVKNTDDFPSLQKNARLQDFVQVKAPDRNMFMEKSVPANESIKTSPKTDGRQTSAFSKILSVLHHKLSVLRYVIPSAAVSAAVLAGIYAAVTEPDETGNTELESALNETVIYGPAAGLLRPEGEHGAKVKYSSTEELTGAFSRAKKLIRKKDFNRAVLILNSIRESNGTFSVRDRADFLLSLISSLEDRSFEPPDPAELGRNGWMYRGWAAVLEGTVSGIRSIRGTQSFELSGNPKAQVFYDNGRPELKEGDSAVVNGILEEETGNGWSVKAAGVRKN